MNSKVISIVAVSVAVIAAAVAAIVVSNNRATEAKAYEEAEAAAADKAKSEERKVTKEADIEAAKQRTAEANKKAKEDELAAANLAKETADLEAQAAADKKAAAEAAAQAERAKADAARAAKDEAKSKAAEAKAQEAKAKEVAAAEAAKAEAEASKLAAEKLKADKIIAEAKALELRKIDYETLERDLTEWKLDLEEREKALKPEKTITSLDWAGGMEDTVIDEKGNLHKQVKVQYDPEKDETLPAESRKLARTDRIVREKHAKLAEGTRASVLTSMEALYVQALRDGRTIDADFYKKSILTMYPDWKFKLDETKESK